MVNFFKLSRGALPISIFYYSGRGSGRRGGSLKREPDLGFSSGSMSSGAVILREVERLVEGTKSFVKHDLENGTLGRNLMSQRKPQMNKMNPVSLGQANQTRREENRTHFPPGSSVRAGERTRRRKSLLSSRLSDRASLSQVFRLYQSGASDRDPPCKERLFPLTCLLMGQSLRNIRVVGSGI